jgi:hypothetical protein
METVQKNNEFGAGKPRYILIDPHDEDPYVASILNLRAHIVALRQEIRFTEMALADMEVNGEFHKKGDFKTESRSGPYTAEEMK